MDNSKRIVRDKFFSQTPQEVAEGAMTVIDAVQGFEPELQVSAVGFAFYSMCNRLGIDAREVFGLLDRMHRDIQKRAEARAATMYIDEEIKDVEQPTVVEQQVKDSIRNITDKSEAVQEAREKNEIADEQEI